MLQTLAAPPSQHVPVQDVSRDDLRPAPLRAEHVLSGQPQARALELADLGHGLSAWLWDCSAGTFHWEFGGCDEVVHVLEGSVEITDQDGGVVRLQPGDVATFRAGTTATWAVDEYVKKLAVTRSSARRGALGWAARRAAERFLQR